MQIFDCDQGSPEWHELRAGIPTASEFSTVLAKGRDGGASKTRRTYLLRLAGERLTGSVADSYTNAHMERGREMEAEARDCYAFMADVEPQRIGFIRGDNVGCSPDALVGSDGLLELKTAIPSILLDKIERGDFPPEHKAQCQGALWIAERDWIDIAIYWPRLPLFVKRAHRDDAYIADLAKAVERFNLELAETVERIKRYSGNPKADLKQALIASVETGRRETNILAAG